MIERALEDNRDLRIAALNVEQAAALHRIRRSELTPTFGVQAAGQKTRLPERMTESGDAEATEQYSVEVGFLSWEIDLFGRLRSLKAEALEQYLATEQAQRAVHTSLVAGGGVELAQARRRHRVPAPGRGHDRRRRPPRATS